MLRCKSINFLFSLIPVKRWQDYLIRSHIQKCPCCLEKMASAEEVKLLIVQEGDLENLSGLWAAVKLRLSEEKREKPRLVRRRWAWVAATVCFFVAVGALTWLYNNSLRNIPGGKISERFQIHYIRVGNEPARAYLYKPHDSKMIIVWAEKSTEEGPYD